MGMDSVFKVSLVLSMIDNLTGKVGGVNSSVGSITQSFEAMQKAGAAMAGVGTGIVGACTSAVTATFDTQNALGEVASLGVQDLQAIESAAKNFSDTWAGTSKADFISASYDIKSGIASLTDEGIAQFTELAALTGKATKSTTETMGSLFATGYGIYKGYYDEMSDLEFGEMFSAGIATAVKNYKTSGSEMASAISMLGATATNANVPMEEQLAILGQLQTTMSGSEAATKYKAFLNSAASAGKKLGLTFMDSNNQLLSMPEILETLRGKYGDTLDAVEKQKLKEAFGTDEAIALIDLLYQNTDQLKTGIDDLHDSMQNGVSVTEEMAAAINNTPEQKFEVVKQKIHNATEELGKGLLPTINSALDVVGNVIQKGSDWVASNQETVSSIMHIVMYLGIFLIAAGSLTAVIGTAGKAFGSLGSVVGGVKKILSGSGFLAVLGPFALIAAAVGGLIALFQACGGDVSQLQGIFLNVFDSVSGIVSNALTAIGNYLPGFLQFGIDLLMNIVTGIVEGLPSLLDAGSSMITSVTSGMAEQLPGIMTSAAAILADFVNVIIEGLPDIMASGAQMIVSLVSGLAEMIPGIATAAAEIINSFLTMIISALPGLLSAGVGMITTILNGIIQALPAVIQSGIQLVMSLLSGIVQNLPNILSAGVSLIAALISGISEVLPNLISAGLSIIGNIISGILQAVPTFFGMIPDLFSNIGAKIMEIDWLEIGGNMIDGIKDGFMSGFESLVDSVKGAWSKFTDWLSGGGSDDEDVIEIIQTGEPVAAGPPAAGSMAADSAYSMPENIPQVVTVPAPQVEFDPGKYKIEGLEAMTEYAAGVELGGQNVQSVVDDTVGASVESIMGALGNMDTSGISAVGTDIMGVLGDGLSTGAAETTSAAQEAINQVLASITPNMDMGETVDMSGVNGAVSESMASVQSDTQSGVEAMQTAWTAGMTNIRSAVTTGMAEVRTTAVGQATQIAAAIKSAFENIQATIPAPKLPHVSVSYSTVGSGNATAQVPDFNVSYYAEGGIMTRPTLFGFGKNKGLVGGEAGDEAILPLDTLWSRMREVVDSVIVNHSGKRERKSSGNVKAQAGAAGREKGGNTYNKYEVHMNIDMSAAESLKKLKRLLDDLDSADEVPQPA